VSSSLLARGLSELLCDGREARETYERALVFLLLRLSLRTRFFLHLALILEARGSGNVRSVRLSREGRGSDVEGAHNSSRLNKHSDMLNCSC
jgi:hypothetical protein